jgi:hypothetical protein
VQQALHHQALLVILETHVEVSARNKVQQSADHGGHSLEVPRPKSTLPGKVQPIQVQVRGYPILGKHDLGTGRKNKIHPMLLEEPKILLFATGVPRQVIGSVELEGVDENGRGNPSLR